ncbi:MAG TPA: bifunctional tRNA (5-methylaminomethyl-2-thiouridine)(34)-methyltransferase MnmD/FAD-dependent 5-carboxymethylaminomethyl-2-thiouridine(34) oxidoreductase MnmC [Rhodocyclaceae bacterium]|nr:bifunctional tRNA (5-methylaminomethyl-2-thiouridine)(34)-methyltransferase MnmD/FAD-dependent 5-carboxymethylaminomethyl-2-thiouridine(34) oxidoreductase MnmC [Rhodocyclaceae bacterium]
MSYTPLQAATLTRNPDGTPYSPDYGDVYHAVAGGPAQTQAVFLAGNDLPERWQGRERFVILETGFGLGLNFLATWSAWQADPQAPARLHFLSVEKHPFPADDLTSAHAAWPEFAALAAELRAHWPPLLPGVHRLLLAGGKVILTLIFGDANATLKKIDAKVDAFYLDGFAPAKNPDLWSPPLFKALARLAAPGATLATWSVAAAVRQGLSEVEFDLEKRPGFGGKRDMLVGRYRSRKPLRHTPPEERRAIVIGAGMAGRLTAERLAARGWQVTILEAGDAPGSGASGNLAGVVRPHPSIDDNPIARLTRAGFLAALQTLRPLGPAVRWAACGTLHLAVDAEQEAMQQRTVAMLGFPESHLQFLDAAAVSRMLDHPQAFGGWYFPEGGWVQPPSLCDAALKTWGEAITLHTQTAVARIEAHAGSWRAIAGNGDTLGEAPVMIIAAGHEATRLSQLAWLPQRPARGQVSHLEVTRMPPLNHVVSGHGYVTPAVDGLCCLGATHKLDDPGTEERVTDHAKNLERIATLLPGFIDGIAPETLHGRVGFRPVSPDRLPMVGPVPSGAPPSGRHLPMLPGLWCVQGFGARGIVWSALMAELLVCQIEGEPLPLEHDLVQAVAPGRFLLRP